MHILQHDWVVLPRSPSADLTPRTHAFTLRAGHTALARNNPAKLATPPAMLPLTTFLLQCPARANRPLVAITPTAEPCPKALSSWRRLRLMNALYFSGGFWPTTPIGRLCWMRQLPRSVQPQVRAKPEMKNENPRPSKVEILKDEALSKPFLDLEMCNVAAAAPTNNMSFLTVSSPAGITRSSLTALSHSSSSGEGEAFSADCLSLAISLFCGRYALQHLDTELGLSGQLTMFSSEVFMSVG
mmetsp:Transcript_32662/g.72154  ORF Transcript_32662/g.72154 Transcript_32662/m.72154 type:complete len:242 (-) Transcript_32662:49-774(-)